MCRRLTGSTAIGHGREPLERWGDRIEKMVNFGPAMADLVLHW
jgi:hypothetical protein